MSKEEKSWFDLYSAEVDITVRQTIQIAELTIGRDERDRYIIQLKQERDRYKQIIQSAMADMQHGEHEHAYKILESYRDYKHDDGIFETDIEDLEPK